MRGSPAALPGLRRALSSFLPPRTSGLVKPVSSGFFAGAATSPLLPTSASARPLLPFSTGPGSPLFQPPAFQSQGSPMQGPELSLTSVHVPLESIKPSRCWRLGARGEVRLTTCSVVGDVRGVGGYRLSGLASLRATRGPPNRCLGLCLFPACALRRSCRSSSPDSWEPLSQGRRALPPGCGALLAVFSLPLLPHSRAPFLQAAPFL